MAKKTPKSKTANAVVESPSSEGGILSVETIKHVTDKRKNVSDPRFRLPYKYCP
jgi:hypothetical protein